MLDNATELLDVFRLLRRGRRILSEGVMEREGELTGAADEVGVVVSWLAACNRAGVLIDLLDSPLSGFSSLLTLVSTPFSPPAMGSSSSLIFRFLPFFSFVSLMIMSMSFCFTCRGVRTDRGAYNMDLVKIPKKRLLEIPHFRKRA